MQSLQALLTGAKEFQPRTGKGFTIPDFVQYENKKRGGPTIQKEKYSRGHALSTLCWAIFKSSPSP